MKNSLRVETDFLALELEADKELKALKWHNRLAGKTLELGCGSELEVEIDNAGRRIWIEGWHVQSQAQKPCSADEESGFKAGYHLPDYPDIDEHLKDAKQWQPFAVLTRLSGANSTSTVQYWHWARSRVFLAESLKGERLTLTLGGFGVGDFRQTRVFMNGVLIGTREVKGSWFEPGKFEIKPGTPAYDTLRFGQVNILALQLGEGINRTRYMDELDTGHAHAWPYLSILIPPYFQHIATGDQPERHLEFAMESATTGNSPDGKTLKLVLRARKEGIKAEVTYRPCDKGRSLVKSVTLTNNGKQPVRLMSLCLGDYQTGTTVESNGNMGFPVYAADSFFLSLDHPAGWAMGENGRIQLRQFPGKLLEPGQTFTGMDTVLGVAESGKAREAFLNHLTPRTRRVKRGHDKPYAILEMFGGWPISKDKMNDEEISGDICLKYAEWLREFHACTGEKFDLVSVDFWQDPTADLIRFNRRFPNGFAGARAAFEQAAVDYGLWIDSSYLPKWHIGENPLALNAVAAQPSYPCFPSSAVCRAAEPIRSIFKNAFLHHVKEGGARLLKFDNLISVCHNQHHGHWPGVYSTEAIYDSVIDFLAALDQACPDVFLMLYWGYRSPWWLLHADMLFESGLLMEAASPSPTPSLYIRDGVAVTLDQGTLFAADVPRFGKDSLGVWLAQWPWNSSIGTERWREGIIMDLCRGNLLFQPWMGEDKLSDDDLRDMAGFLRLLRQHPACFAHPLLILGDPWRNEPYGYACSDGKRAFVAVNNFSWNDYSIPFENLDTFGLNAEKREKRFTVFRHYPEPAKLTTPQDRWSMDCLRPFQVALYEIVPDGEAPSLKKSFPATSPLPAFKEPTVEVALEVKDSITGIDGTGKPPAPNTGATTANEPVKEPAVEWRGFSVAGMTPISSSGGILVVTATASREGKAFSPRNMGTHFKASVKADGLDTALVPVLPDKTYPATWQAWRITLPENARESSFKLDVASRLDKDVNLAFRGHFVPREGLPEAPGN